MWGMMLKAICLVNFFGSIESVTKIARVWLKSSSIASLPAPETDW